MHLFPFPRSSNQVTTKAANSPAQPVAKISSKPSAHNQRVATKGENSNIKCEEDANSRNGKAEGKTKESQSPALKQTGQIVASKVGVLILSMKHIYNSTICFSMFERILLGFDCK